MTRMPALALIAAMFTASVARAELTVLTDQFILNTSPGAVALVIDKVSSVNDAINVTLLNANEMTKAERRPTCIVAVNHRDPSQDGVATYVGVQLIKFFRNHDTPGIVQVGRNGGWRSSDGSRELLEIRIPVELAATSIDQFSVLHNEPKAETSRPLMLGTRKTREWHGLAASKDPESYSATELNLGFWARNPLLSDQVKVKHVQLAGAQVVPRFDNRLIRFQLTSGVSVKRMPSVEFTCDDSLLESVAIRIFRPFSGNPDAWAHLSFR